MVPSAKSLKSRRSDNRLPDILKAAARLFAQRGYAATSMRDIAVEVQMIAGSLYYFFASKEELLLAVYKEGVKQLEANAHDAIANEDAPWLRLESLCRAHLETVLRDGDFAQVLVRVLPNDVPALSNRLKDCRRGYEDIFRSVIAQLPLQPGSDRKAIQLMLIGSLNWAVLWFNPNGRYSPRVLARKFVKLVKEAQDVKTST